MVDAIDFGGFLLHRRINNPPIASAVQRFQYMTNKIQAAIEIIKM
jgi:hypothetical protein